VILVTGAAGSVGVELCKRLRDLGHEHIIETDIETMDVTNEQQVRLILERKRPDVIYHLAGAKHAPDGELDPWHVCNVNAVGTRNVLEHRGEAKVILASTCKACDPETAYGASKLVAERLVLNAGGVVVRYYNIPEAGGNVFRLWESLPESEPIPWTDCYRYFVSLDKSVELTISLMDAPSGRYAPPPGDLHRMYAIAKRLYPGRALVEIPPRRGDRRMEPRCAKSERIERITQHVQKITSPHDPVLEAVQDDRLLACR
jgi:FlaA1/EpsC-like NDP-sugar epimerase